MIANVASVSENGAILMGKYLSCDGFDDGREAGILTHFHGDHIQNFEASLQNYGKIFVTPATRNILIAIKGDWLAIRRNLVAKNFFEPFDYKDERITFYPSIHTLGSAQVLVETDDCRILNTGDFREGTVPIEADILIIDSTYGDKKFNRTYIRAFAVETLVKKVEERLKVGPVCISANRGKLQESMNILYTADIEVPLLFHRKIVRVSKVFRDHGHEIGEFLVIGTKEAEEILQSGQPHIAFYPDHSHIFGVEKYTVIRVSDWDKTSPLYYHIADNKYIIGLPDHCEFNGILAYVENCSPKLVITDAYRSGNAGHLARHIRSKLGIQAIPMP